MTTILKSCFRLYFWLALLGLSACGGGSSSGSGSSVNTQRGDLVSVTQTASYSVATLKNLSTTSGYFTTYQNNMAYPVNVYNLVYWTADPAGQLIQASGLLAIPQTGAATSSALLNFEHGTIFADADAPTNSLAMSEFAALMASTNFIVTLPDYIGYGKSVSELHPYLIANSLATTTIDMLRASKQYLANQHIAWDGRLFLAGYSEGGYASVATHEFIQQQYAAEFTVTADVAGDGPYDLSNTANTLLSGSTLPYAPYVAFVFKAYDDVYGWKRIGEIFQAQYVGPVNNDFYGAYSGSQIDQQLNSDPQVLFTQTFLGNFLGTGETEVKARLSENNVYDWTPTAPLRLYHGKDDVTVPYANATTTQTTMKANGASDVAIVDCTLPSGTPANHSNCALPYLNYMLGYFIAF